MAYKGAKVILACRSKDKAMKAIDDLVNGVSEVSYKDTPSPIRINRENAGFISLDLAGLKSIEVL